MPGPAIAAIAGGLGSALIGARSASKAADAQSDASNAQLGLQADMFNRMDDLQGHLFRNQMGDVYRSRDGQFGIADRAGEQALNAARGLRNRGDALSVANYRRNRNALRGNEAASFRDINGNLRNNLRDVNNTYSRGFGLAADARDLSNAESSLAFRRGMGAAREGRDDSVATARDMMRRNVQDYRAEMDSGTDRLNRTQTQNIGTLRDAQDESLARFDPAMRMGNNALSAYAYNLGIGKGPKGYGGLESTPGAQFLLNEGREQIEGGAAGAGGLYSGATLAALENKRAGIVATDRDNQMAQLMGLGQVGQNAAGSMADIQGMYSGRIADQRNATTGSVNALRAGYTGQIGGARDAYADRRIGANNLFSGQSIGLSNANADRRIGIADQYANRGINLGQNRLTDAMASRNNATQGRNAMRTMTMQGMMGANDAFNRNAYGVAQDYANSYTNATDTNAARGMGIWDNWLSGLSSARSQRANLYGTAAQNYVNNASNALANRGDARAGGIMGGSQALMGGLQNGLGIYGLMGGQFPQAGNWTNPFAGLFGR